MQDLPVFYRENCIEVIASLPYYSEADVDRLRGNGTFLKSIKALQKLYSLGYGNNSEELKLNLVYNPQDAFLPSSQASLEEEYKKHLDRDFGISFNQLYTFANMPIGRFEDFLLRTQNFEKYIEKLINAFNPETIDSLMCRQLINVGWNRTLYDCDFNQMLDLPVNDDCPQHVNDLNYSILSKRAIVTDGYCFGCTAGQGST